MDKVSIKNLIQVPDNFKLPELVASFVSMMVFIFMPPNPLAIGWSTDLVKFATFVYHGFFFICTLQVAATLFGEKSPILGILVGICGFIFYLSVGSVRLNIVIDKKLDPELIELWPKQLTEFYVSVVLSIITSFIYSADVACRLYNLFNG